VHHLQRGLAQKNILPERHAKRLTGVTGIAYCSIKDIFNKAKGRKGSFGCALLSLRQQSRPAPSFLGRSISKYFGQMRRRLGTVKVPIRRRPTTTGNRCYGRRETMLAFKTSRQIGRDCEMVEVFNGKKFVGALYPDQADPNGLHFISSHVEAISSPSPLKITGAVDLVFQMEEE